MIAPTELRNPRALRALLLVLVSIVGAGAGLVHVVESLPNPATAPGWHSEPGSTGSDPDHACTFCYLGPTLGIPSPSPTSENSPILALQSLLGRGAARQPPIPGSQHARAPPSSLPT